VANSNESRKGGIFGGKLQKRQQRDISLIGDSIVDE
jgi:hypothetical protein